MKRLLRLFAVGIALTGTSAFADDFTTSGSGSQWTDDDTWSGAIGSPGDGVDVDNVTLNHTVILNASRTIGNFTGNNGVALGGSTGNDLTIDGTASIAEGISFRFQSASTITTNGQFDWGSQNAGIVTSAFVFNGETNYRVSNNITTDKSWSIGGPGEFNRTGGGTAAVGFDPGQNFTNQGTFSKSDGDTFSLNFSGGGAFQNSGNIEVSGGTLAISNYAHSGGTVTIGTGATFDADITVTAGALQGTGVVDGNVSLDSGTFLNANTVSTVGQLDITGNLSFNSASTLTINLGDGLGANDVIDVTGIVDVNGANLKIVADAGGTYVPGQTFDFLLANGGNATDFVLLEIDDKPFPEFDGVIINNGSGQYTFRITAVPEPSSLAVLGLVSVGAIARRRRRA